MTSEKIPYYWSSVDWPRFMADYPPPPHFDAYTRGTSDEQLQDLQEHRFLQRVSEAWRVDFYREHWSKAGLEPGDIRSVADIDQIPTFTSEDLKVAIESEHPFGSHQSFALRDPSLPLKLQTSGGTTGLPRPTLFDPIAWEVQAVQYARAFWAQGARPHELLQITLTNSLANIAWCAHTAAYNWLGAISMTTGSGVVTGSKRQLELAREWGTTGWVAFGEYLKILAETAVAEGIDLKNDLRTRFIHSYLGVDTGGQLRRLLEETWGAPVYDNYGTHEIGLVGFECAEQDGMHVNEDTAILQVVDPGDGAPLGLGETGNLVVTSLHRSVPPIIRYDLKDLISMRERAECACGIRTAKLSGFLGRSDEMVKLRANNVFPRAAQGVVLDDTRTTGEYLCVVENVGDGLRSREVMTVRVEQAAPGEVPGLRESLETGIKAAFGTRVAVELVPAGSLAVHTGLGGEGKIKRLLDLR
jgi:phenylacetate-CoA ligase